jgi:hypothetical protein
MTRLQGGLAVYSRTVSKIYTNYSVHCPSHGKGLVILPDFEAYHDMIHNVPSEAIEPTAVRIILGEALGKQGLWVMGKLQGRKAASALPLALGIKAMRIGAYCEGAFLPILQYGDLREMTKCRLPYLHLHRVCLDRLTALSTFDRNMLASAIQKRLETLLNIRQDDI